MKSLFLALGCLGLACAPVQRPVRAEARTGAFLRIIGTNDFHGALEPRADSAGVRLGGGAYVAAAIRAAAAECAPRCEVLLLDGGDMFQGTPASNTAYGKPVVELYNELGYAAAALGNHEFDWGIDTLRARMRDARFGILGANVRYADGRDVEWIPNDTIVVRGRARVGIIGLSTQQTPTTTRPQNVAHLRFVDPAPVVDAHARSLRARGATHVVVVGHVGGRCSETCEGEIFDLAQRITEPVDAIVGGHSHSLLNTTSRGIPIVQARSSGRAIDVLDVPFDRSTPAKGEIRPVLTAQITPDPAAAAIVARWTARVAGEFSQVVGNLSERLSRNGVQSPLGNLIADAQRAAAGTDVAVMNNGGIRADLEAGEVTYGELFEVQPFDNTLVRLTMRGSDLRRYLQQIVARGRPNAHVSGASIVYSRDGAAAGKVDTVLVAGRPIDDAASYTVSVNDFIAAGGDGLGPPAAAIVQALPIIDRNALRDYISRLPQPVEGPRTTRIRMAGEATP
ncbi:MAG: 5'-nucleotidase C-terminal domain-containing protein [Gemmatimonadaceae bacterium]|nr:5'-nucleotidase C-terminal domain-containing protein [Gemmatimonadaceae bacterium]